MFRDLLLLASGAMLVTGDSETGKSVGAVLLATGIIRVTDRVDGGQVRPPSP